MFNQIFVEYLSSLWISFKGQTHYVMNCLFFILHALRAAPISPIKLNLALQKRGTTNNKPLGWIIVIGQSDTGSSSIITFIRMNTGSRGHFSRLCVPFTKLIIQWKIAGPKPQVLTFVHPILICWATNWILSELEISELFQSEFRASARSTDIWISWNDLPVVASGMPLSKNLISHYSKAVEHLLWLSVHSLLFPSSTFH